MANVLEKICNHKREEIAARKQALPLETFQANLTPSTRSLFDALSQPEAGFILECKKASPSKGLIRANFDLDEIISAYAPRAAAISVLTDEQYFQGSFAYLDYVRQRVHQPVLNKDFFVDPYQVYLARYHDADAILLMLSVLSDEEYTELAAIADSLSLDVLTEVSNEQETQRAIALGAKIIGINNRNLRDLSTDLATTERLAPMIPDDRLVISESGIYTHDDVRRLAPLADGFLVGSSLMAQADVALAVNQLIYGHVKVCGVTLPEDALMAKQAGASYAGLIFAPKSPRCVSLHQAQTIVSQVPFHYVGVFVDQPIAMVCELAQKLDLAAVQLHGNEDSAYIATLRAELAQDCQIWKAYGVSDALPALQSGPIDRHLLDSRIGNQSGGTGQRFDWTLFAGLESKTSLALAGGLDADNIADAKATGVGLLDVNSGVESRPGVKNHTQLTKLFNNLRHY
ncbi:bifunctional indole-3-glycerol-phosphate synthase TrpC/phosphoribosylanthranilate isomerase TrpF [Bowmanella sp. JS7-9]|uniref:Multifunctional fusion protein n=1 Tax=Pseudobowmanella zhangzhouensis TaxID=1537679 RepID=A0ABW1XML3_9ALTE|nr:bifunctional indole-3-glycerol-phosphate synthase TrpC/phosphoribosylanthranilate isomerase TrpF [Bowmanella sp. JS7-9]TBX22462.1 indole-3-glycerol phosphate synthase [Bowmanella sp. JS7-9]